MREELLAVGLMAHVRGDLSKDDVVQREGVTQLVEQRKPIDKAVGIFKFVDNEVKLN